MSHTALAPKDLVKYDLSAKAAYLAAHGMAERGYLAISDIGAHDTELELT